MGGLRRETFGLILLVAMAGWPTAVGAEQPHPFAGNRVATVMTQNVYVGANLAQVAGATSFPQLFQGRRGSVRPRPQLPLSEALTNPALPPTFIASYFVRHI